MYNKLNLQKKDVKELIENKAIGEVVKSEDGRDFKVCSIRSVKEIGFEFEVYVISFYNISLEKEEIEILSITYGEYSKDLVVYSKVIKDINDIKEIFMLKGYGEHLIETYGVKEIGLLPYQAIESLRLRASLDVLYKYKKEEVSYENIIKYKDLVLSDVIDFEKVKGGLESDN